MYPVEEMKIYLKTHLRKKRFGHCLRVAELSEKLAIHYGESPEKAYFAGLVHDIAKDLDDTTCEKYIEIANIQLDPCITDDPNLAHGEIGAYILEHELGITDTEILEAVKWHTYGHENMSTLSKIIYLADVVEPVRKFENIDKLRDLIYVDLNKSILYFYEMSLTYLNKHHKIVHHNTYEMVASLK